MEGGREGGRRGRKIVPIDKLRREREGKQVLKMCVCVLTLLTLLMHQELDKLHEVHFWLRPKTTPIGNNHIQANYGCICETLAHSLQCL